jgi:UDP:flavonoid glycosyltransferase YjiC (YdhE family)
MQNAAQALWSLTGGTIGTLPSGARYAIALRRDLSSMTATGRHFAVIAPPTPGHINPLQILGAALIDLGHRVTVIHQADVAPLITASRIGFAPLAPADAALSLDAYNSRLAAPDGLIGLTRMISATAMLSRRVLAQAPAAIAAIGADAVIADSAEPAGALVAGTLGLPCVVSVTGLPLLGETAVPPPFLGWRYRDDALGRFRNRGGYQVSDVLMRPITGVLEGYRRAHPAGRSRADMRRYVAQCPAGLDYPRRQLPPHFVYGGPWRTPQADIADLPRDARPLVFCSLGTLQGARRQLFATMAEACALVGARAVIGHGGGLSAADEAALPGDPLVRAFWPQQAVLRRCSAAVLHGGFNTVLDALAAGVPIVTLPIAFEQPGTAARVAWIGAGETIAPRRLTAPRLAATLRNVLHQPSYRLAASRLAAEIATAGGAPAAAASIHAAFA